MANEPSVDEQLAVLLRWQGWQGAELTWDEVERSASIRFPDDFKRLTARFPSGVYADYFDVFSPIQSPAALDRFLYYLRENVDHLARERDDFPEEIPFALYPEDGGLLPWGFGAEHIFSWKTNGVGDPNDWTVVYYNHGFGWGEYAGGAVSFMLDVITGRFVDDELYYEPDPAELTFRRFDDQDLP